MNIQEATTLVKNDIVTNGRFSYEITGHYDFCEHSAVLSQSDEELQDDMRVSLRYSKGKKMDYLDYLDVYERLTNQERRISIVDLAKDEWTKVATKTTGESKL